MGRHSSISRNTCLKKMLEYYCFKREREYVKGGARVFQYDV